MKNPTIDPRSGRDIDKQVAKILRGLGNPDPPLDLDQVRELLRLDRRFYSSTDTGALREFVSRIKVGSRRLFERPTRALEVVRKASLRALWIPDQKRILIDADTPPLKQRWAEAHEIVHSVAPWHKIYLLGDDDHTLRPECYDELEHEANHGAGGLLFLGERFIDEASDHVPSLDVVHALSKSYGNTLTSTLWRLVERAHRGSAIFGFVCPHPFRPTANGATPRQYLIESPMFRRRFPRFSESEASQLLQSYCTSARGGPLGEASVTIRDPEGNASEFYMESFSNRYDVLTLGVEKRVRPVSVALP